MDILTVNLARHSQIRIMRTIRHRNVVNLLRVYEEPRFLCLVQARCTLLALMRGVSRHLCGAGVC